MADWNAIDNVLNDANAAVASWFTAFGRPVIAPTTTPQQVALEQATGIVPTVYPVGVAPTFFASATPDGAVGLSFSPIVIALVAIVALVLLMKAD